ncbi:stage V sporulation protein AC [Desulfuribacillus stibiiarsenatis]|uniref:Stage V sporulation protein AC n=1 Tax=Desulfuribacillus stibiiarsenatis TaxID=1390249 RepID=A0A1E5L6D7_9FIRM|nr:stage V sporulation protein AC [Desulfuribacillus stibiiarsenatis]OEH85705.1 stage V sporulation protein AC [Desulfuribacillus stibiiarsenatis]
MENNPQKYQTLTKQLSPKPPILRNVAVAFVVGGLICMFGQFVQNIFLTYFNFTPETVGNPTVAVMIFIAALLTGLGVYDKLGQFAGAGSAVPVTGFANSITSAAMEHRSEGLVLGVGGNMFKLAGSVIVFGVVAAFFIALIKTLWRMI